MHILHRSNLSGAVTLLALPVCHSELADYKTEVEATMKITEKNH